MSSDKSSSSSTSSSTSSPSSSASSSSSSTSSSLVEVSGLKASAIFPIIQKRISPEALEKTKAIYRFDITSDDGKISHSWVVDLKNAPGDVRSAAEKEPKADCIIGAKDSDFVALMTGKLSPQNAFVKGKLKVRGNILVAQKLSNLMPKKKSPAQRSKL